jgi:capsular polysaccharide export protein
MTQTAFPNAATPAFTRSAKTQGSSVHWGDLPSYERILLLQGPVGPFFARLSRYWKSRGAVVKKINFNPGDDWFYPPTDQNTISYKHRLEFWEVFIHNFLVQNKIQAVFLFGSKRNIHLPIRALCKIYNIDLWILEEGYFRPGYFTLEKNGVNANSPIAQRDLQDCIDASQSDPELPTRFKSYRNMILGGFAYWLVSVSKFWSYPNYDHHRELNLKQAYWWIRSIYRHYLYRMTERSIKNQLINKTYFDADNQAYFLLPLQVHDDSQITHHSQYDSIEMIIEEVINSYKNHLQSLRADIQSPKTLLIIKHHPMDRGHKNYKQFIDGLAKSLKIEPYIVYVHDIHIPSLLPNIKGCITANSTLGLQALLHGVPVINLAKSFYDKPGLTYQEGLDHFWSNPGTVNPQITRQFRQYVIKHSQVAGCLYDRRYQLK